MSCQWWSAVKQKTAREFCRGFPSLACFISQFTLSICESRIELSVRRAAREGSISRYRGSGWRQAWLIGLCQDWVQSKTLITSPALVVSPINLYREELCSILNPSRKSHTSAIFTARLTGEHMDDTDPDKFIRLGVAHVYAQSCRINSFRERSCMWPRRYIRSYSTLKLDANPANLWQEPTSVTQRDPRN